MASDCDLYGGDCKIVDADGVVYDAILRENGTIDQGWWVYQVRGLGLARIKHVAGVPAEG
jgi:hypothetical protein